jgi:signal transduction histidine kinase
VQVKARADGSRLAIRIDDNGRGFAFEGEVSADAPSPSDPTPRSLQERVRALNGRLELESSPRGATILIDVPLEVS